MSIAGTELSRAIFDAIAAMAATDPGAAAAPIIFSDPNAPRPGDGSAFIVIDFLASQRLGTAQTWVEPALGSDDGTRTTALQHSFEVAITVYGPGSHRIASSMILALEIPEVQDQIAAAHIAFQRAGSLRAVPVELGVGYEDRHTFTIMGAYEDRITTTAPALREVSGTSQTPPVSSTIHVVA